MPAKIERNRMKVTLEVVRQWFIHHPVKPGCVGHDEERSFAAQVVHGNVNALSRSHSGTRGERDRCTARRFKS